LELYAPWCGHCKTLRPEWAKLATKLKGIAKVAKIDASIHRKFDSVYGLKGYPQVVLIPAGPKDQKIYYNHEGARTTDSLYDWALEKIKQNKGFLVERLTSEEKWVENCVSLDVPLCVITFLPKIIDSSEEERTVYLEIIKGVTVHTCRPSTISEKNQSASSGPRLETTRSCRTSSVSSQVSQQCSSSTRNAESSRS
jgi:thiol-disulfide isomerase/thioredoxin